MKRVVIVDDDRRTRRVLQILIERLGLESQAFEGAEQALASLRVESAALVLTDLKMPRVDGIEFMRGLRQLDEGVPIIMLTAHGSIETAVAAMKLGAVDYLSKPFDVGILEGLIRRSLEVSRHRRENRYFREVAEQSSGIESAPRSCRGRSWCRDTGSATRRLARGSRVSHGSGSACACN